MRSVSRLRLSPNENCPILSNQQPIAIGHISPHAAPIIVRCPKAHRPSDGSQVIGLLKTRPPYRGLEQVSPVGATVGRVDR